MFVKQISVFVENKAGRLADLTELLGGAGVDLRALWFADTAEFGILRVIVDKADVAVETLKQAGIIASVTDVLAVGVSDTPGALSKVLRILADEGVSVEYTYAFISRKEGKAYVILRVDDNEKAIASLTDKGVPTVTQEELF